MGDDTWLTRQEVADREKLPVATLNQWASQGKGPKYARFGRHARYRRSDVIAWKTTNSAAQMPHNPPNSEAPEVAASEASEPTLTTNQIGVPIFAQPRPPRRPNLAWIAADLEHAANFYAAAVSTKPRATC